MLRKFLMATATAALMTSAAIAADTNSTTTDDVSKTDETVAFSPMPDQFLASDLMGISVFAGTGDKAERIGEVSDAILSPSGAVEAVVVDVGGFLGIGEKPVALDYDMASWSKDEDGLGRLSFAVEKETLESAKAFDEEGMVKAEFEGAEKTDEVAATQPSADGTESVENRMAADKPESETADQTTAEGMTEKPKSESDMAQNTDQPQQETVESATEEPNQDMAQNSDQQPAAEGEQPSIRDGLSDVNVAEMTAEDLIGATVLGENDETIGEIGDIVLSNEQNIEAYIIEVGGFLGMGEKPVAIDAADLNVLSDDNGNLYVFTPFTQEQLEEQPEFDQSAYENDRDGIVLKNNQ